MPLLHPYQRRWLADKSRFKIGMFARQTGKTFTTTLEIVNDCVEAELCGRRVRWVILSRGERQALEAMNEGVRRHLTAYGILHEALSYECRANEVVLPGGSRITALPANPDTARGFSANVFLDEFAFHQDSAAIWRALFPVVSKPGLKLRITSTPNGRNNRFHSIWTGEDQIWSRHRTDIHQAVSDGLDRDIPLLRQALGDEDAWRQEYELEFLDEASAFLDFDTIIGCEDPLAGKPALYQGGPCWIGNDIARRQDYWVAWVVEEVGDVLWTREIVTLRNASFAVQDAELARLLAAYQVRHVAMDQTGMGEKPVEDARARYPGRVTGVHLAGQTRLSVATIAKQVFETRRLRIPAGDPDLRADLGKLKKITSEAGIPRLTAERDGTGHADRLWACFLALSASDPLVVARQDGLLDWYRGQFNPEKFGPNRSIP